MRTGRPRKHDRAAVIQVICSEIAAGMLVQDACKRHDISRMQLHRWCAEDKDFRDAYARAREDQAHAIAEEAISIADGVDESAADRIEAMAGAIKTADDEDKDRILNALAYAAVQRDRIRVDARKWMASKIAPRLYGEKQQVEHQGAVTVKVQFSNE